jgi:hypothetical protein
MTEQCATLAMKPVPAFDVHPAANMFPPMTSAEFDALVNDVRRDRGIRVPLVIWRDPASGALLLLDGRHRVRAVSHVIGDVITFEDGRIAAVDRETTELVPLPVVEAKGDPYELVISLNLLRRHLTGAQKREIVAALLKAKPERSDNATAKIAKVSDKTVTAVRNELETTSEIPKLDARVGSDGRSRPFGPRNSELHPPGTPTSKRLGASATKRKLHGKIRLREITIPYSATRAGRMLVERWSPELCRKLIADLERRLLATDKAAL